MIHIIIGANFGDEGKGMTTACVTQYQKVTSKNDSIIIKYSGGAQAAHTVNNIVNHQYGSGDAPTYLHDTFIFNPMLLAREYKDRLNIAKPRQLFVNENVLVTSPYDIFVNQVKETIRGDSKYGSCGLGIWETIRRKDKVTLEDVFILDKKDLAEKLSTGYYKLKEALSTLEIPLPGQFVDIDLKEAFNDWYNITMNCYSDKVFELVGENSAPIDVLLRDRDLIFEGSQGLLLDDTLSPFPMEYRTPTSVCSKVPLKLLKDLKRDDDINTWYTTRTYFTRHGAGPFPTEQPTLGDKFLDKTNKPNNWQGSLRFGRWDQKTFEKMIKLDREYYEGYSGLASSGISITYGGETDFRFLINSTSGMDATMDLSVDNYNVCLFGNQNVESGRIIKSYTGSIQSLAKTAGLF